MTDQHGACDELVETPAAMAAKAAPAYIGDGVGRERLRKRFVAGSRGAAEFGHRNAVALQQRGAVHPANLCMIPKSGNRFSDKIMLKKARARWRLEETALRSGRTR